MSREFPPGFLWGTASAAHQVEGGNRANDWWAWEEQGHILSGDTAAVAVDHYHRYREDFRILRRMNNNAHRLSIEWSRLEPRPGEWDKGEFRHYRDVLGELREQGMKPMVTLHHFTSPTWFARRQGWAASGSDEAFRAFAARVADELGDLVEFWVTINEPNIYALQGWITGEFPPGRQGDAVSLYKVLANLRRGHLAALGELSRRTPGVPVGIAHHKWVLKPAGASFPDRSVTALARLAMDRWPTGGGHTEEVVRAPADFIGLNHYTGQLVAFDPGRPREQFARRFNPPGLPESDFGWAVNPAWMLDCLLELKQLGRPVYVTENGIATTDDQVRQRFLVDTLACVQEACRSGVDVRGYFHWTGFDNFEWAQGYRMRFGLVEVDRRTLERTPKPSAALYSRIALANRLPE